MDTLRKFGLHYCDVPTLMWNVSILLRPTTLNIDPRYKGKISVGFYIVTLIIFSSYFYVYVFSVIWYVLFKSMEGGIVSTTVVFHLGSGSMISTTKFIYMLIYHDTLRDLIGKYIESQSRVTPGSRFSRNLLKVLRIVKRRALIFWIVIMLDGTGYAMKPILTPGKHLMEDIEYLYGLSPMFDSPYYEISYLVTVGGIIFTVYLTASITSLMIVVTGCVEAQMLALSQELTLLWEDAQYEWQNIVEFAIDIETNNRKAFERKREKMVNAFIKNKLQDIIKKHTFNIYLIKQIEQVFQNSLCVEFFLLIISLIAELVAGLENTYILMPFELAQVTMDCVTGQRLIDSSLAFTAAVYDSKWENFDVTNMKTVLIMLINSQKEMAVSAGGFTTISYICLMSVARMIYSTYTALRSTMN